MRKKYLLCIGMVTFIMSGCGPLDSKPGTDPQDSTEAAAYSAPTLPPVNTATPTATTTKAPTTTPTPFTVVIVDTATPEGGPSTAMPTLDFNFGGWERYETKYTGIAFDTPVNMQTRDYGRLIRIGDLQFTDEAIQLFVEFQVDQPTSYYLPEGVNPYDPHSILDGILQEFEQTYTDVTMIRPIINVNMHDYLGADTALRTELTDGSGTEEMIWYLATVVHGEVIVRVYAHSPASTGGIYLALAQHMIQTIEFLQEQ